MKILSVVVFLALSLNISAKEINKEVSKVNCILSSYYLKFEKNIEIYLKDPDLLGNGPTEDGKEWEIAWSLTECEDSTSIYFDRKEYKKFIAGSSKSIYGRLEHAEPDIEIKSTVSCSPK